MAQACGMNPQCLRRRRIDTNATPTGSWTLDPFISIISFSLSFLKKYSFLTAPGLGCCTWAFSLVAASRGLLCSCGARASHCDGSPAADHGLQGTLRASVVVAQGPSQVGSSRTRDRIRVPRLGRWILSYWTTREVPISFSLHKNPPVLQMRHWRPREIK